MNEAHRNERVLDEIFRFVYLEWFLSMLDIFKTKPLDIQRSNSMRLAFGVTVKVILWKCVLFVKIPGYFKLFHCIFV